MSSFFVQIQLLKTQIIGISKLSESELAGTYLPFTIILLNFSLKLLVI